MVVWNFLFMINLNGILNWIAVGLGHERASVVQVCDCETVHLVWWFGGCWSWKSRIVFLVLSNSLDVRVRICDVHTVSVMIEYIYICMYI